MLTKFTIWGVRIVSVIASLLGVALVWYSIEGIIDIATQSDPTSRPLLKAAFFGGTFGLGAYPFFVSFLVIFRLSPVAVRHFCVLIGIVLFVLLPDPMPYGYSLITPGTLETLVYAALYSFIFYRFLCDWIGFDGTRSNKEG